MPAWVKRSWKLLPITLVALLMGCGPKPRDIGAVFMCASPIIMFFCAMIPLIYQRLLRRTMPWQSTKEALGLGSVFAVAMTCALIALPTLLEARKPEELFAFAAIAGSGSGITYSLLSWSILNARRPKRLFATYLYPVLVLLLAPSVIFFSNQLLGLGIKEDPPQLFGVIFWVLPAFYGVPPLLLILATAFWVYRKRARGLEEHVDEEQAERVAEILS